MPSTPQPGEWSTGNQVQLLHGGAQLFPAMVAALEAAQQEVWLASYLVAADEAAQQICHALTQAARRGVVVRVVVDGFGSLRSLATLREWLEPAGVELRVFRPLTHWWQVLQPAQWRRMHLKLCVVDGVHAFVGGINLIDDHHEPRHPGRSERPRLDFAVALRGPAVAAVAWVLRALWQRTQFWRGWPLRVRARMNAWAQELGDGLTRMRERALGQREAGQWGHEASTTQAGGQEPGVPIALLVRDNLHRRRAIERSLISAMAQAEHRVDLVTPYFYPGWRFRLALLRAARQGVRVRLLLQGKPDYWLASLAARVLYSELLAQGVEIYEYTAAFLHAKVALVDADWATVGSSNIDPLSLLLNLEANVVVRDAGFNHGLSQAFEAALAQSQHITVAPLRPGWRAVLGRGLVAWLARTYLRLAGSRQPY